LTYSDYVGRHREDRDRVTPELLSRLAATLGVPTPDTLPPLWHWALFQEWVPPEALGPDGHPARGGFLPPVHDLPRRMWAGGEVRVLGPLPVHSLVARRSVIRAVREKQGGSGRLVFVEVEHTIAGADGPAIGELQTIVYRAAEGAPVRDSALASPAPLGSLAATLVPDSVLLFRYSALTGNGHRIHYDADYVRDVEGYPELVVHGPLQATLLAGLVRVAHPDRRLARFRFRGQRPAFAGAALALQGWEADGWRLRTVDPSGHVCMEAEAWFD